MAISYGIASYSPEFKGYNMYSLYLMQETTATDL